jgi:hypothetical protein
VIERDADLGEHVDTSLLGFLQVGREVVVCGGELVEFVVFAERDAVAKVFAGQLACRFDQRVDRPQDLGRPCAPAAAPRR